MRRGRDANRRRSRAKAEVRRLDAARAKGAGEEAPDLVRNLETARGAEREAASEQAELLGSDVSPLLALPGHEALPPGTVLGHRMVCRHVTRPR